MWRRRRLSEQDSPVAIGVATGGNRLPDLQEKAQQRITVMYVKAGTRVCRKGREMPAGKGMSYHTACGVLLEPANIGTGAGWDVVDLRLDDGTESSAYAFDLSKPTKYVTVYIVQGNYGSGWDDLTGSDVRKEARRDLRDYEMNEPNPHRLISRKILRTVFEQGKW